MLTYALRESNVIADTIVDVDDVDCAYSSGSLNAMASLHTDGDGVAYRDDAQSSASDGEGDATALRT